MAKSVAITDISTPTSTRATAQMWRSMGGFTRCTRHTVLFLGAMVDVVLNQTSHAAARQRRAAMALKERLVAAFNANDVLRCRSRL
jgi:hypothetical protein